MSLEESVTPHMLKVHETLVDPPGSEILSSATFILTHTLLQTGYEEKELLSPLKDELLTLKNQLQAQAKVIESLSQTVTLLEKESGQQQFRIEQLEAELRQQADPVQNEILSFLVEKQLRDMRSEIAETVVSLQEFIQQRADTRLTRRNESIHNLAQEVHERQGSHRFKKKKKKKEGWG
nr:PREDICTED: coiled-coil domain-containing protein 159 isoform X1 [Latimeria chalumnae]|eukprot:XP_014342820.1 PREDICTED: coiled-coil domain-containing protein 159 isoform X1 [Latimeria chalumnae]